MKKKGITLIALIITIVILLILAGVTMSFVVGDNGVVTQAQKSKIRTDQASAKEEIDLEVAGSRNDEGYLDLELLNENLMKNLKNLRLKDKKTGKYNDFDNDKVKIENLPTTVYYKQTEVTINDKQLISNVAKDVYNYGMYVDYPIDLSGDGNYTNDWKIFYEDETGRVFLIAADYVPNTCEALKNGDDLIAGMVTSDGDAYKKCCYRWDSIPEYDCYDGRENTLCNNEKKKLKSQCSFPNIFMPDVGTNGHYYCSDHVGSTGTGGNINSRCAAALQCTGEWSGFVNSKYAEYAIGGPTLEMWVASWNVKHGKNTEKENEKTGKTLCVDGCSDSGMGYKIGESGNGNTKEYISLNGCAGYSDKLYFPHRTNSNLDLFDDVYDSTSNEDEKEKMENASCYGYWLASPSGYLNYSSYSGYLTNVRYDGYVGTYSYSGEYRDLILGIRPIVLLKSGVYVEVEEDEIKDDGTVIKSCRLVK